MFYATVHHKKIYKGILLESERVTLRDLSLSKHGWCEEAAILLECENLHIFTIYGGYYVICDRDAQFKKKTRFNQTLMAVDERAKLFRGTGIILCIESFQSHDAIVSRFKSYLKREVEYRLKLIEKRKKAGVLISGF